MNLKIVILLTVLLAASAAIFAFYQDQAVSETLLLNEDGALQSDSSEFALMETDGLKHLIPLNLIRDGGPPKDGIPSIDDPVFADVAESQFMSDSDTVIGVYVQGEAKAYPLFILVWHEIVNDRVGDVPVSVTYCPLCYTSQVFERVVDGQEVEFGTSGKLYNSNLLMYDRLTDSYWSQALGLAVTGDLSGRSLNLIPFDIISWGDWKLLHPDTLVLTTDTGHVRSYATDPYADYYSEPRIMFPVAHDDDRMHPKEVVVGISQSDVHKAYRQDDIESKNVVNDNVGNVSVLLVSLFPDNSRVFDREVGDEVLEFIYLDNKIFDSETNSEWDYEGLAVSGHYEGTNLVRMAIEPGFWFEWVAFHPDTLVFGDP